MHCSYHLLISKFHNNIFVDNAIKAKTLLKDLDIY